MRLLLDTCTFLWLSAEPSSLSNHAVDAINNASNTLFVSDASLWEICLKWQAGKLKLPSPPRTWCTDQIAVWRIESLAILQSHLFRVVELPFHHKDPYDRLLVAQAIEERMTIVTPDDHIRRYPTATLW